MLTMFFTHSEYRRAKLLLKKPIIIDLAYTLGTLCDRLPLEGQCAHQYYMYMLPAKTTCIFKWKGVALPYSSVAHRNGFPGHLSNVWIEKINHHSREAKVTWEQKRHSEATCSTTDFATYVHFCFCMICDFFCSCLLIRTLFSQLISGSGSVYCLYVTIIGKEVGRSVYVKQTINS